LFSEAGENDMPTKNEPDKFVEYVVDLFKQSLDIHQPDFLRMQSLQNAYDLIEDAPRNTMADLYMPVIRTAVEVALPSMMEYLFPRTGNMFSLRPSSKMIPYETVSKAQDYFNDLILDKIGIESPALLALKDAIKHNIGYMITEYKAITPLEEFSNIIFSGGKEVGRTKTVGQGAERIVTSCRYLHWASVVPTPDGGKPSDVTCTFLLDFIRSDQLEELYATDAASETPAFKLSAKEIIKEARENKLDGYLFPMWFVATQITGGVSSRAGVNKQLFNEISRRTGNPHAPVNVPILKCYFQNRHVWLANGRHIIRDDKDTAHTLNCPITKFTMVPDSNRWFPRSDVDAGRDAADGKNTMINAVLDLLTMAMHPTSIRNRAIMTNDQDTGQTPNGQIDVMGDVRQALTYVQPPQPPAYTFNVIDMLDQEWAASNGQPRQLQGQGTAGLMRGGMHGFESFLQTTFARQKLAGAVIETNGLKDLILQIIIHEQARIANEERYITEDPKDKNRFIEKFISPDELRHAFAVKIDLRDKFMRSPIDRNNDIQIGMMLMKDPRWDWTAVAEEFLVGGDRHRIQSILASDEVMQKQAQQMAQIEQQKQQAAQGAQTMTSQAEAGAQSQEPQVQQ
jgi:hypothetical protein